MTRCPHCPVPADRPCLAQVARHPRWCELIDPASAIYDPRHIATLLAYPGAPPPPPTPSPVLTPEQIERQRLAENCPYRDCVGCGCSGCRCRPEGRRPGQVVTILDCLACIDAFTAAPSLA